MKPYLKAILFIGMITILELMLRKGVLPFPMPFPLPGGTAPLITFSLFAVLTWLITRRFVRSDQSSLEALGISLRRANRVDFFYGLLIGIGLWGIVSLVQSWSAGFTWELRPDISMFNLVYGFLFILIADLGTELYARGYGLTRLKDSFGHEKAIMIMSLFAGLLSFSPNLEGGFLLYTMLIPILHATFFAIIYFKTKRLGASLGMHTGANFVTISFFDLRPGQAGQAIPSGLMQADTDLDTLSLTALQLPWVGMAIIVCIVVSLWWKKPFNFLR